jgi:hypothetical protein
MAAPERPTLPLGAHAVAPSRCVESGCSAALDRASLCQGFSSVGPSDWLESRPARPVCHAPDRAVCLLYVREGQSAHHFCLVDTSNGLGGGRQLVGAALTAEAAHRFTLVEVVASRFVEVLPETPRRLPGVGVGHAGEDAAVSGGIAFSTCAAMSS